MRQSEELISNRIDALVGATTETLEYLHLFGVMKYIGFARGSILEAFRSHLFLGSLLRFVLLMTSSGILMVDSDSPLTHST